MQSSLDNDTPFRQTTEITASPRVDYWVNFTTAETYTLWLRGYPTNAAGDSVYVGLAQSSNPPTFQPSPVTGFAPNQWSWANVTLSSSPATLPISTTGLYTVSLWMREDGLRIDRFLLTTDTNYLPTGFGPAESVRQAVNGSLTAPLTRTIVYTYDNLYRLTDADYSTGEDYAPMPTMQAATPPPTCASRAANRLEFLNGQQVYTLDDNRTPLRSGDFVAICSTATP